MTRSTALAQVLSEASDIARETHQRLSSGHVLLALFTVRSSAESFLLERGIDEDRLLARASGDLNEPAQLLSQVLEQADRLAAGVGSSETDCLHVLVAMLEHPRSSARQLLLEAGTPVDAIRAGALRVLTRVMPIWMTLELARVSGPEATERPHAALGDSPWELAAPGRSEAPSASPPVWRGDASQSDRPAGSLRSPQLPSTFRTEIPRPLIERDGAAELTVRPSRSTIAPAVERGLDDVLLVPTADVDDLEDDEVPAADDPAALWKLSPARYPWLTSLARNLSVEAREGRIEPLVGREREVETLIDILGKRFTNNPCLIGEPGVGKTAIVESLAHRLAHAEGVLSERILLELEVGSLLVGTHFRGAFSEKLKGIREEVERSEGRIVIFFDELHTLVGAGASGDGALDAANELKTALARGQFPCIGATTPAEWKKHVESDPALRRRFYPVQVNEPTLPEAEAMIRHVLPGFATHHGVSYDEGVVTAAVKMSTRFIPEGHLPDKAIALIDFAGSRAARSGAKRVTSEDIAGLVAERAQVPKDRILVSDKERLLKLEALLAEHIVGHADVLRRVSDVLRRNAAGFSGQRPEASFLFLGPSGVGKTETAKALARILFGSLDSLVHIDLSEYSESHSVARLVGAPPGYVGHDAGGQLSEAIRRRPSCVLLLDEIEKAHREVLQIFLQVLDEGRVTDGRGNAVSFAETIIVMTSNVGSEVFDESRSIGFGGAEGSLEGRERRVLEAAKRALAPELFGRVEDRLVFGPLSREEAREVARRLAKASSDRLSSERGIAFTLDDGALEYLVRQGGFDARFGARPMRQVLSRIIEAPIASRILEGRIHAGEHVLVTTRENGGLVFQACSGDERMSLSQRPMQL
ncbi:MAG: ATP-dependent Clp protease ATP-binding subunit [Deltaproteobacteria bacterium]|nr:ATP-dependent Clp protease ATP-binding subunit [Deltaproteobacteria bacterium]